MFFGAFCAEVQSCYFSAEVATISKRNNQFMLYGSDGHELDANYNYVIVAVPLHQKQQIQIEGIANVHFIYLVYDFLKRIEFHVRKQRRVIQSLLFFNLFLR